MQRFCAGQRTLQPVAEGVRSLRFSVLTTGLNRRRDQCPQAAYSMLVRSCSSGAYLMRSLGFAA